MTIANFLLIEFNQFLPLSGLMILLHLYLLFNPLRDISFNVLMLDLLHVREVCINPLVTSLLPPLSSYSIDRLLVLFYLFKPDRFPLVSDLSESLLDQALFLVLLLLELLVENHEQRRLLLLDLMCDYYIWVFAI